MPTGDRPNAGPGGDASAAKAAAAGGQQQQSTTPVLSWSGDTQVAMFITVLLLLNLMKWAMTPPCTC
ncbi:hypothetical protein HXX76_001065 [Chlamydomonas incerta]|uniref:Uncharacterized protein n=1 Tax=Chlamydomonas incerta TaxID=51695 RepID=A0A836B158_CHLIN|nr:hypothetical protein HXX76_001065 [Chlamydomonas incerta]|eukprot:KAG2444308.1 hypothetical protein HXX76_001065 [Chlamydomonas incerta]